MADEQEQAEQRDRRSTQQVTRDQDQDMQRKLENDENGNCSFNFAETVSTSGCQESTGVVDLDANRCSSTNTDNNSVNGPIKSDIESENNNRSQSQSQINSVDKDESDDIDGSGSVQTSLQHQQEMAKDPPSSVMKCEMCDKEEAKYTCPRCSVRTCCVACVNQHKERLGCDGQRDKTAFVSFSQYSDMHLLNDYRFLENTERTIYSNKISNNKHKHVIPGPYNHMNKRSKLLMTAAQKRGVRLRMVSMALSKHKNNTSYYQMKSDSIEWHIEWQFLLSNTLVKASKVPENTKLIEAARKFTNFTEFPHLRKALEGYKKERLDQCRFLLKIEGLPANMKRFYSLDPQASVTDNLKGHCLTEYPTICIVPSESAEDYTLLSQEDLVHMQKDLARHLVLHHKELDASPKLQAQLMNPASQLYRPATTASC